jgi:hypothetical protein
VQVNVYSVPLKELLDLPGSGGHEDLIEQILDECWFADEVNDMIEEDREDSDEEGVLSSFGEAVTRIIKGKPLTGPAFAYGYAFEAICWGIGSTLCMVSNYFHHSHEEIDQFLQQAGVRLRLADLSFAGPLLAVPEDGLPYMGWWSPDQISRAMDVLAVLPLDGVEPNMAADVRKIVGWLDEVFNQDGDCIVGFRID